MSANHPLSRSAVLGLVVTFLTALPGFTPGLHAELGIAAGNSAGESGVAMNDGTAGSLIVLPPAPSINRVERIDKTTVKVFFDAWTPAQPFDQLYLYRAADSNGWEVISSLAGNSSSFTTLDAAAPAGHDYRYSAIVIGTRKASGGILPEQVGSDPSTEKRIVDAAVKLLVSSWWYPVTNPPALPAGEIRVENFIPEDYIAVAGQPPASSYVFNGPLTPRDPLLGGTQTEKIGYVPRARDLHVSGTWQSYDAFDFLFTNIVPQTSANNYFFGESTINGAGWIWNLNDSLLKLHYAICNSSGDTTGYYDSKGFDGRSNPYWQMLPSGGSRTLSFHSTVATPLSKDDPLTLQPDNIPVGSSTVAVSANGANPGEKAVEAPDLGGKVKLDVRPRRNPTVAVYPVYRTKIDAQHPTGVRIDEGAVRLPTKAALEAELHAIYGERANVWFTVTVAPQELEFTPADDKDGNGKCAITDNDEKEKLRATAEGNGYDYSIFMFSTGGWETTIVLNAGTPQERTVHIPGQGGKADSIPGPFAVSDSPNVTLLAHELGHCMGLNHTFRQNTEVYGNCVIPDASDSRVMGYGRPGGKRLIKPERDVIFQNIPNH